MTGHLTRPRALWALLAVIALLVVGLGAASRATSGTSAAWTDDVHTTTDVALGSWSADQCRFVDQNGSAVEGKSCSVDRVVWQDPPWESGGERLVRVYIHLTGDNAGMNQFPLFTADLRAGTNAIDDWDWASTRVESTMHMLVPGGGSPTVPVMTAQFADQWFSPGSVVEVVLAQRVGAGG